MANVYRMFCPDYLVIGVGVPDAVLEGSPARSTSPTPFRTVTVRSVRPSRRTEVPGRSCTEWNHRRA
jgi:hypothetical protein